MPNYGYKWDKTSISYRFDAYVPDYAKTFIRSAFKTWSADGSRGALQFSESPNLVADINIQWSASDLHLGNTTATAMTSPVTNGGIILSATLIINGSGRYNWTKPLNGGQTLYSVATHEIGHALGLAHSQVLAIMLPDATLQMLQKDDLKSLAELYTIPPSEQSLWIDLMNKMGQFFVNLPRYPTPKPLLALLNGQGVTALQIGGDDIFYFNGITEAYMGLYAKNKFIPRKPA